MWNSNVSFRLNNVAKRRIRLDDGDKSKKIAACSFRGAGRDLIYWLCRWLSQKQTQCECCLQPRCLSRWKLARKWRWKGEHFASYFSPSHGPLHYDTSHSRATRVSHSPLCENEVPEEERAVSTCRERLKRPWRWVPFTADWLAGCLTSFLTSWVLIGCPTDWLTDLPVDLKTDELIDWLTDWPINRLGVTVGQIGCSTAWLTDWLTNPQVTFLFYFRRRIHHCILQQGWKLYTRGE